ncbi:MAG TPA: peptidylprolyl isomerase [Terriglobales bacterium]|nr:peptidylprolyl isomerase [Terriglobales bacterium]
MRVCLVLFLLLVTDAGTLPAQTARIERSQEYGFNLAWFNLAQASSLPESATPQKKTVEDQPQPSTSTQSPVPPEDPVITLHGVCSSSAGATQEKDESCKTVVSRREFEFLANSINLGGKPISMGARQNLAKTYAQYLVYEQPAKKAGLENTEQYAEIMRWLRLRMLTDLLREKIFEEFRTPSEAEVARYYQENVAEFERVHVARILIPRNAAFPRDEKLEGEKQGQDKKLLALASEARQRTIKGDDPEQIQKDLCSALGIGAPPPTDLGHQARKDFVAEESAELFSLKPGDVSKLETELASYVIYKVISRETMPENEAKEQISQEIARRNIEKANQAITQPVQPEYNGKYFGPPVPDLPAPGASPHP